MKTHSFVLNPTIYYGNGVSLKAGEELKALGVTKVMIVTDQGVLDANICNDIIDAITEEDIEVDIFSDVETNPTDKHVIKSVNYYIENNNDGIIAIGGGSSLDVAKSTAAIISNGGRIQDYEDGRKQVVNPPPPLILVPTTSGTGSEVVSGTIITDTERQFKMHIVAVSGHIALCDPLLTKNLPSHIVAATGLDALSHAIGAYVSVDRQPITDAMALYAIKVISESLLNAIKQGDLEARSNMTYASMIAGISMKGGGSGEHAFAHGINALFNIHHGVSCAIFLADVMEHNIDSCVDRYAQIAEALGVNTEKLKPKESALEGIKEVRRLVKEAGIPSLNKLNVKSIHIPEITNKVLEDKFHLDLNPVPIRKSDIEKILEKNLSVECE